MVLTIYGEIKDVSFEGMEAQLQGNGLRTSWMAHCWWRVSA